MRRSSRLGARVSQWLDKVEPAERESRPDGASPNAAEETAASASRPSTFAEELVNHMLLVGQGPATSSSSPPPVVDTTSSSAMAAENKVAILGKAGPVPRPLSVKKAKIARNGRLTNIVMDSPDAMAVAAKNEEPPQEEEEEAEVEDLRGEGKKLPNFSLPFDDNHAWSSNLRQARLQTTRGRRSASITAVPRSSAFAARQRESSGALEQNAQSTKNIKKNKFQPQGDDVRRSLTEILLDVHTMCEKTKLWKKELSTRRERENEMKDARGGKHNQSEDGGKKINIGELELERAAQQEREAARRLAEKAKERPILYSRALETVFSNSSSEHAFSWERLAITTHLVDYICDYVLKASEKNRRNPLLKQVLDESRTRVAARLLHLDVVSLAPANAGIRAAALEVVERGQLRKYVSVGEELPGLLDEEEYTAARTNSAASSFEAEAVLRSVDFLSRHLVRCKKAVGKIPFQTTTHKGGILSMQRPFLGDEIRKALKDLYAVADVHRLGDSILKLVFARTRELGATVVDINRDAAPVFLPALPLRAELMYFEDNALTVGRLAATATSGSAISDDPGTATAASRKLADDGGKEAPSHIENLRKVLQKAEAEQTGAVFSAVSPRVAKTRLELSETDRVEETLESGYWKKRRDSSEAERSFERMVYDYYQQRIRRRKPIGNLDGGILLLDKVKRGHANINKKRDQDQDDNLIPDEREDFEQEADGSYGAPTRNADQVRFISRFGLALIRGSKQEWRARLLQEARVDEMGVAPAAREADAEAEADDVEKSSDTRRDQLFDEFWNNPEQWRFLERLRTETEDNPEVVQNMIEAFLAAPDSHYLDDVQYLVDFDEDSDRRSGNALARMYEKFQKPSAATLALKKHLAGGTKGEATSGAGDYKIGDYPRRGTVAASSSDGVHNTTTSNETLQVNAGSKEQEKDSDPAAQKMRFTKLQGSPKHFRDGDLFRVSSPRRERREEDNDQVVMRNAKNKIVLRRVELPDHFREALAQQMPPRTGQQGSARADVRKRLMESMKTVGAQQRDEDGNFYDTTSVEKKNPEIVPTTGALRGFEIFRRRHETQLEGKRFKIGSRREPPHEELEERKMEADALLALATTKVSMQGVGHHETEEEQAPARIDPFGEARDLISRLRAQIRGESASEPGGNTAADGSNATKRGTKAGSSSFAQSGGKKFTAEADLPLHTDDEYIDEEEVPLIPSVRDDTVVAPSGRVVKLRNYNVGNGATYIPAAGGSGTNGKVFLDTEILGEHEEEHEGAAEPTRRKYKDRFIGGGGRASPGGNITTTGADGAAASSGTFAGWLQGEMARVKHEERRKGVAISARAGAVSSSTGLPSGSRSSAPRPSSETVYFRSSTLNQLPETEKARQRASHYTEPTYQYPSYAKLPASTVGVSSSARQKLELQARTTSNSKESFDQYPRSSEMDRTYLKAASGGGDGGFGGSTESNLREMYDLTYQIERKLAERASKRASAAAGKPLPEQEEPPKAEVESETEMVGGVSSANEEDKVKVAQDVGAVLEDARNSLAGYTRMPDNIKELFLHSRSIVETAATRAATSPIEEIKQLLGSLKSGPAPAGGAGGYEDRPDSTTTTSPFARALRDQVLAQTVRELAESVKAEPAATPAAAPLVPEDPEREPSKESEAEVVGGISSSANENDKAAQE